MTRRFNYRFLIKWIIVVPIFIFLGNIVWENWNQVKEASFTFRFFPLVLSTLIFAFSYFIQIWAWYLITFNLKIAIPFHETLASWFYSQLGKYLPGKVWILLSRFYFYESKGKSRTAIMIAFYFETITMVMAAGLIFLVSLLFSSDIHSFYLGKSHPWLPFLIILPLLFLHPKVLQRAINRALTYLNREPISISMSYADVLWILAVCLLCWVMGGVGFYLFIDSVFIVSGKHILFLTGALAISSILGLVAVFAPSGLGVREGFLVYLLSSIMPSSVAVILSVLTRLWVTFIEIGLVTVVYLAGKLKRKRREYV